MFSVLRIICEEMLLSFVQCLHYEKRVQSSRIGFSIYKTSMLWKILPCTFTRRWHREWRRDSQLPRRILSFNLTDKRDTMQKAIRSRLRAINVSSLFRKFSSILLKSAPALKSIFEQNSKYQLISAYIDHFISQPR